jgi:hypothetical protein
VGVVVPVDRLGVLVVGAGVGLLRTGTVEEAGGALVVVLVGAGVFVETLGFLATVVCLTTTLAFAFGFAGVRGARLALAGFALAVGVGGGVGVAVAVVGVGAGVE